MKDYDFSGWATRNNLKCSDGRTIMKDAFKDNDGQTVPLVWNHQHGDPAHILGHADLENREEGVYAYCKFNETESGKNAKLLVQHGDVQELSIFANKLKQQGGNVLHGAIREVSLVLAGANPGAFIDSVMSHSEDVEDGEAIIYTGENIELSHAEAEEKKAEEKKDSDDETIKDVWETLTDKQKTAVYAMVGLALKEDGEEAEHSEENEGGDESMKKNVFSDTNGTEETLSHAEQLEIIKDAQRSGSLKEACLAHSITDISYLFPDNKVLTNQPEFIKRKTGWVSKVMNGVHHSPFARIRTNFADITADEARAKGYTKGNKKVEEVIALLKRTTDPDTIYKLQKLDRDDVLDITDFDVVAYLKKEMRMMLEEEIARAILIGDGRSAASNDKIDETKVRPIWTMEELFTIHKPITLAQNYTADDRAKATIKAAIKAFDTYDGSGSTIFFTTPDLLSDLLLLEDQIGHRLYKTKEELATAMLVDEVVSVPVMANQTRTATVDNVTTTYTLGGLIVDLDDYNVGADKGGNVTMFEDFDINYNKQEYLIETRISGSLVKPKSAIALEYVLGN